MASLFGRLAAGAEVKSSGSSRYGHVNEMWGDIFGGRGSRSGRTITWKTALEVTTVLRCAVIIAEGICSVPFLPYRKSIKDGLTRREEAVDHAIYDLMRSAPNDWQTSFEFRETIGLHLALCKNAFVFLNRVRGNIVEMIPFEPGSVQVNRKGYELTYTVTSSDGTSQTFPSSVIWHLRAQSWNSWMGMETISLAREAIGLALATEESHARLHDKSVRPSGVLSVEGVLDDKQFVKWRRWIDAYYSGLENAGKALILDRSAKWQSQQMTGVDAQHLQTRGFQIEELCRAMGVLPIMVGYTGDKGSTYASAEQMFLAHYSFTLRPLYERMQSSADRWLLTKEDRKAGIYTDFTEAALLRATMEQRGTFWKTMTDAGIFVPNEARDDFGYDGMPGLDRPRIPLNTALVGPDGRVLPNDGKTPDVSPEAP